MNPNSFDFAAIDLQKHLKLNADSDGGDAIRIGCVWLSV